MEVAKFCCLGHYVLYHVIKHSIFFSLLSSVCQKMPYLHAFGSLCFIFFVFPDQADLHCLTMYIYKLDEMISKNSFFRKNMWLCCWCTWPSTPLKPILSNHELWQMTDHIFLHCPSTPSQHVPRASGVLNTQLHWGNVGRELEVIVIQQ